MVPARLRVPAPVLVRPPLPLITPAYAPGAVLPFTVSVLPPMTTLPPLVPAPDKALIVWSAPRFRIAPVTLAISTPLLAAIALLVAVVRLKVPALTVVAPVYRLTPLRVRVPLPVLVNPPAVPPNPMTPENVLPLVSLSVRVLLPRVTLPDPDRFLTVWLVVISSVPDAPTATLLLAVMASPAAVPRVSTPPVTLVAPL